MATSRDVERPGAEAWVPEQVTLPSLAEGIDACRGCELYQDATHGVPGEGPQNASLMVVGEQPGDQEDRQARPFVGPAGLLLVKALEDAGVDPASVFRTNAVKHFRWDPGRAGKRIHKGPSRVHVAACGPWLVAELDLVRPTGVVLLGATAGSAVFGPSFRVGEARGRTLDWPTETFPAAWSPEWVVPTMHPSAVLRSRTRTEDYAALVEDLRVAASLLPAA
jgi:uracil-DNA glycosylase family protein